MHNSLLKVIFISLFAGTVSLSAQPVPVEKPVSRQEPRQRKPVNRDLQYARQLLNQKKYDIASALLEDMYQKDKTNQTVVNLLFRCYQSLDLPLKQQELMRRQIELNPNNFNYHLYYAESAARLDEIDEAMKRYDKALELSFNSTEYRRVINSILSFDLNRQATEIIIDQRKKNNDSLLLSLEMGTIFEREKKYKDAAAEYTKLLKDTTILGREAVTRIRQLLNFEESAPVTETYLIAHGESISNNQALNLLSLHYLNTNRHETAYQYTLHHDSISGFKGMIPISFMSRCFNQKLFELVVKVGDYLNNRYPENIGVILTSSVFYGNACYELEQFDKAEKVFRNFFNKSRSPRDKATALNRLGEIYLRGRGDYKKARPLFDSVIANYPQGVGFQRALLNAPDCYLFQGDFKKAIIGYRSIKQRNLTEEIREELAYNLGLLHLFNKQLDSATTSFNKLIVDYKRGYFVNDVLKHLLIIDEAADQPMIINDYARLLFFKKLGQADSVVAVLTTIAENPSGIIADMALLELAVEHLNQNDTVMTLTYLDRLSSDFSESYYIPEALKIKADILLNNLKTKDEGIIIYRRLLEEYPFSSFNEAIREKLRALSQSESA